MGWNCLILILYFHIYANLSMFNLISINPWRSICIKSKINDWQIVRLIFNKVVGNRTSKFGRSKVDGHVPNSGPAIANGKRSQTGRTWSCDQSHRFVPSIVRDRGQTSRATGLTTGWATIRLIVGFVDQFHRDGVIKWKHFPRYWPLVRGIPRSPVNYPHKGWWRGALMFSLICVWIKGWVNNREAGDVRRYRSPIMTSPWWRLVVRPTTISDDWMHDPKTDRATSRHLLMVSY